MQAAWERLFAPVQRRIIRTAIAGIRRMHEHIYADTFSAQYIPASIKYFLTEDREQALFSVRAILSDEIGKERLPFRFVREVGKWKGFICNEIEAGYCFRPLDSECYYAVVRDDFSAVDVYISDKQAECSRTLQEILQYVYQVRLLKKKKVLMHAAVVIYKGYGIAFSGDSGAGKSTHANLWKKYLGAGVLNYDKPGMTMAGIPYVFGTPFGGKEHVCEKGFYPLKGIVFINQAKKNQIKQLSKAEAFSKLYAHYMLYPVDDQILERYEAVIAEVVTETPVYDLYCDISGGAVECVLRALYGEALQREEKIILRIKENYTMREIAGEYIAFPRGSSALNHNEMILLNESSAFLWKCLEKETSKEALVKALLDEYEVDRALAEHDVDTFLKTLEDSGMLKKEDEN